MTIPGVDYYIALLMKVEIGEVGQFRSGDRLASYAGIVPITYSSGKITRHGRITRDGSAWLRWAIVEATLVHLRYDTPVTRFYHRVAEKRGSKTARVAAARKLLTVCWSVLRNRRPYFNPVGAQV